MKSTPETRPVRPITVYRHPLTDGRADVRAKVLAGDEPLQRRLAHERVTEQQDFVLDIEEIIIASMRH